MNSRAALIAGLFASAMATASCEDSVNGTPASPATPTGPSSLSDLLLPRLGGNWGGELTLNGVTGGMAPQSTRDRLGRGRRVRQGAWRKERVHPLDHTVGQRSDGQDGVCVERPGMRVHRPHRLRTDLCAALGTVHAEASEPYVQRQSESLVRSGGSSVTASFDDPVNPKVISGRAAYTYNVDPKPNGQAAALVATQSFQSLTRR